MRKTIKKLPALLLLFGCVLLANSYTYAAPSDETQGILKKANRPSLVPFESEAALDEFLRELAQATEREESRRAKEYAKAANGMPQPPAPAAESKAAPGAGESITNVQHAGVDEGDIVKLHGDHLVVLRRGRLFTVGLGQNSLTPLSSINAYAPDIDPRGTWYDEMLISGDTIVVIGYRYQRGGTEIGLFRIDPTGRLSYRATYHLRSNDYYSSRNYASRLIGSQLIFYTPLYLNLRDKDPYRSFPALRKWHAGATDQEFQRIVSATQVYRPLVDTYPLNLHTVTTCDLAKPEMECKATAVLGPAGRVFYVSPGSVYVWMTPWGKGQEQAFPQSLLYQLPLSGGAPKALRVAGGPIDQFSFLEDGSFLNVLVRAGSGGEAMWHSELSEGNLALLRVPLSNFSAAASPVTASQYKSLPRVEGYTLQNRFVGDYLLYGSGNSWGYAKENKGSPLYAFRYASHGPAVSLSLNHSVDRLEALGEDAIVVGSDGKNLYFTPIDLGLSPQVAASFIQAEASQGETRSHGFFYKPQSPSSGYLGLPIHGSGRPGYAQLVQGSASILFLRNDALRLAKIGALESRSNPREEKDSCQASCADWYGNARPLFIRGRIFALLGYELVEGKIVDGHLRETGRINYLKI